MDSAVCTANKLAKANLQNYILELISKRIHCFSCKHKKNMLDLSSLYGQYTVCKYIFALTEENVNGAC